MKRILLAILLLPFLVNNQQAHALPPGCNDSIQVAFSDFLSSLIDSHDILIDSSWKKHIELDSQDRDWLNIAIPVNGDDPDSFVVFPFADIKLAYAQVSISDGNGNYRFFINKHAMPIDTVGANPVFNHIIKFTYREHPYLVLTGGLRDFNGYGDRVHYNYFFDLIPPYTQHIYENAWGITEEPQLYGDLNGDGQLDRIKFDGVMYPAGFNDNDKKDLITITAETYRNKKWQPLKDSKGKRYYIHVLCNDIDDGMVISDYHWMRKLK